MQLSKNSASNMEGSFDDLNGCRIILTLGCCLFIGLGRGLGEAEKAGTPLRPGLHRAWPL